MSGAAQNIYGGCANAREAQRYAAAALNIGRVKGVRCALPYVVVAFLALRRRRHPSSRCARRRVHFWIFFFASARVFSLFFFAAGESRSWRGAGAPSLGETWLARWQRMAQPTASMRQRAAAAQSTPKFSVEKPSAPPSRRGVRRPKEPPIARAIAVAVPSRRSELEERLQYLLQVEEEVASAVGPNDLMQVLAELRRRRQERKAVAVTRRRMTEASNAVYPHVAALVKACESTTDEATIDILREFCRRHYAPSSHEKGRSLLYTALAELLLKRRANESDTAEALSLLDDAVADGHAGAMLLVGLSLRDGVGVPKDLEAALTWVERSADAGYAPAMFELGAMYEDGVETAGGDKLPSDWGEAAEWYKGAADLGHTMAQLNLGKLLWKAAAMAGEAKPDTCDKHTVADLKAKSRAWLEMAASSGSEEAVRLLRCR
ncbi:Sel1 domain-containing protein [Trypanosoma conorhini]|uniref:Sel1 domain-containing protein n=1 Tax=Trypanosoma conorhini TaxID=83891 RepID=A0A3R7NZL6_9TRYP|nr:Sel1 domain-containing protein [Trypanosoma conorhini]RNF14582.1 Sel1 domain-containing protein [Trypanosoma conorhini]